MPIHLKIIYQRITSCKKEKTIKMYSFFFCKLNQINGKQKAEKNVMHRKVMYSEAQNPTWKKREIRQTINHYNLQFHFFYSICDWIHQTKLKRNLGFYCNKKHWQCDRTKNMQIHYSASNETWFVFSWKAKMKQISDCMRNISIIYTS